MAITNNLKEWNPAADALNPLYESDSQRTNGFKTGDYLHADTFNSALRTATVIPVAIIDYLTSVYSGSKDITIDQSSSKTDITEAFKDALTSAIQTECNALILGVLNEAV